MVFREKFAEAAVATSRRKGKIAQFYSHLNR